MSSKHRGLYLPWHHPDEVSTQYYKPIEEGDDYFVVMDVECLILTVFNI